MTIDPNERPPIDISHLILDYVTMCEKFGPLDFETFVEMWRDADAIAQEIECTPECTE